jgi:glutathione S-transferase
MDDALHEKGAAYEEVKADVYSPAERSPEFLRLNPFGQIPVREDDGLVIAGGARTNESV